MKPIVYLFGYEGWGPHVRLMKDAFIRHNMLVRGRGLKWVDVRLRRSVRAVGFSGNNPEKILGRGYYSWISDFGNKAIEGGHGIKDIHRGFLQLQEELHEAEKGNYDLIMFCSCDLSSCHRYEVRRQISQMEEGKGIEFREWPYSEVSEIDLRKHDIEISPVAIQVPLGIKLEGIGSALTIAPGTSVRFFNRYGEEETRIVGRVLPSPDENHAILKTGYLLSRFVYPYCIYTIRKRDDLDKVFINGGKGEFSENTKWATGLRYLENARSKGQILPLIFADASSIDGLIYYARLTDIEIMPDGKKGCLTTYQFDNLTKFERKYRISRLRLAGTGNRLPKNFIRNYALCETPYEIFQWYDPERER